MDNTELLDRARGSVEAGDSAQECLIQETPESCGIVIFGATGDLAQRKIIPALYRLSLGGHLPHGFFAQGTGRTVLTDNAFRQMMEDAARAALPQSFAADTWQKFAQRLYYVPVDYADPATYRTLAERLRPPEKRHDTRGNRIFYLAIPPTAYETVIGNIGHTGLSQPEGCYSHIVIEKPIGRDLASALRLNQLLNRYFEEKQVYRMDHYLAKETVQNILMFRFANSIFEPLWNNRYIDHVEITVSETVGVGHRAGYYEQAGIIRDMFQNHIFQLLSLTTMEPPALFKAGRVHDEKAKVFRSMRPFDLKRLDEVVVLGQYGRGTIAGQDVVAYREEEGVPADSNTPTYAAMTVYIDNWRWQGVPFYLRSGKRMTVRKAEIEIHFRPVPHMMFSKSLHQEVIDANRLVLRIQPDEGIGLSFQAKRPGSGICLDEVLMDFPYRNLYLLDDYERVLLNCMQGDQMLFTRNDTVELTWELLTPVLERLERVKPKEPFPNYAAGSAGPKRADELLRKDRLEWHPL